MNLDEQQEAHIVEQLKKSNDIVHKDILANFEAMKDIRNGLVERGMPIEIIQKFIGRMLILTNHTTRESDIYPKVLEMSINNIITTYSLYLQEFGESVFVDMMANKRFIVINPPSEESGS